MATSSPAAQAAEWSTEHILNRIGANHPPFEKFRHAPTDQQNRDLVMGFMQDLEGFFMDYLSAAKVIERDPMLSPAGIQEKLVPLQRKFNERLNGDLCKRVRTLQQIHIEKVDRIYELPPETITGNEVVIELRAREARDYIGKMAMAERIKLLFKDSDPFLLHCFETAPTCIELVPAKILEQARLNRVMRKRSADLLPLQDERVALLYVVTVLSNIPRAISWVSIIPGFLPMGDSVFPEKKEIDPIIGEGEDAELMRLVAEMTSSATAAA